MSKKYCIGNTHFDPVWLWTWDEAMASIRATFRSALTRMEEYPDFVYSFATPPVFDWILETEPDLFARIQERVMEGRWELGEGWWLQPDCYSAAGESYVRQGLYGQRWLMTHFGKKADTVFNIDSFGHSPMLPQILQKSGIRYYVFTRPERHHIPLESPFFRWMSPDGSEVLTYRAEGCYDKNMTTRLGSDTGEDEMVVYGVTDHGGAPTKEALDVIHNTPHAACSTLTRFFMEHQDCPHIEQREFVTGDFGPYANLPQIKAEVRRGEITLTNAEKALVLAGQLDTRSAVGSSWYANNKEKLTRAWQDVLFQQFHDILGGACIKDAYRDAFAGLGRAYTTGQQILHTTLQRMTAGLTVTGYPWNLVVWNLNDVPYEGLLEAEVQWIHEFDWYQGEIRLTDSDGNIQDCQIIREKSVLPGFRSRFVFQGQIPAMGYRVYNVCFSEAEKPAPTAAVTGNLSGEWQIDTEMLTITFDKGCITGLTNKKTGQKLGNLFTPAAYQDTGDTWAFNIRTYDMPPLSWDNVSVTVEENGHLRTVIRSHFTLGRSTMTLYYTIPHKKAAVDVRWVCNWNDKHKAVKLHFDTPDARHQAAVPYGVIERGENPADMPLGSFVITENYTLLSADSFAYHLYDGKLGVTLFRSPICGDLRIFPIDLEQDYDILAQGINEGRLSLLPEPLTPAEAAHAADSFINVPIVIDEAAHPSKDTFTGQNGGKGSFASVDGSSVVWTVWKPAEEGDGTVLRLAEYDGREETVTLRLMDTTYTVSLKPYEIKTLLLANGVLTECTMLEETL